MGPPPDGSPICARAALRGGLGLEPCTLLIVDVGEDDARATYLRTAASGLGPGSSASRLKQTSVLPAMRPDESCRSVSE